MMNIVNGRPKLKQDHEGVCKGCSLGKNSKCVFHNSESRSNNVLELIHSYLCGPMIVALLGGFFNYVDDYSRKTWIYILKF